MYTCYIQSFKILASFWAEQAGLNLTWPKISEDTFSSDVAYILVEVYFKSEKVRVSICPFLKTNGDEAASDFLLHIKPVRLAIASYRKK